MMNAEVPDAVACPYCQRILGQVKAGRNRDGIQRFKCMACQRRYTPEPRLGYPQSLREQAIQKYGEGKKLREIGRELGVNHQTVRNWVQPLRSENVVPEPEVPVARPRGEVVLPTDKQRRPTIHDVAAAAGVSNSTISNYLNQKGHMSPATRQRIESAIETLHFTPSALVRAIRRRQTRIFGVVLFGLDNLDVNVGKSIAPPLLAGINRAAEEAEYDVLLYPGWPYRPRRHPGLPFLDGHIDGLLWVAPKFMEPNLERLTQAGLPVVTLLTRHVPERVGYANADNLDAMHQIVAHLVSRGHRRITFCGPVNTSNFRDRYEGYRQALAAHGLPVGLEGEGIVSEPVIWPPVLGLIVDRWLALPERPTAVVLPTDGWAGRLLDELTARGFQVPGDFAVVGFDDIPDAQQIGGGLTTIRQPFRQIGIAAVENLLSLIEGAPVENCRTTLPGELVVRHTTASI